MKLTSIVEVNVLPANILKAYRTNNRDKTLEQHKNRLKKYERLR